MEPFPICKMVVFHLSFSVWNLKYCADLNFILLPFFCYACWQHLSPVKCDLSWYYSDKCHRYQCVFMSIYLFSKEFCYIWNIVVTLQKMAWAHCIVIVKGPWDVIKSNGTEFCANISGCSKTGCTHILSLQKPFFFVCVKSIPLTYHVIPCHPWLIRAS